MLIGIMIKKYRKIRKLGCTNYSFLVCVKAKGTALILLNLFFNKLNENNEKN